MKDGTGPARPARLAQLFVVDEEEGAIAAVEARQHDRSADVESRLPAEQLRLGDAVALVEPRVGIELVAAIREERAALKVVGSGSSHETDLRFAHAAAFGPLRRGGHGDFLHRVEAWAHHGEKSVSGL